MLPSSHTEDHGAENVTASRGRRLPRSPADESETSRGRTAASLRRQEQRESAGAATACPYAATAKRTKNQAGQMHGIVE